MIKFSSFRLIFLSSALGVCLAQNNQPGEEMNDASIKSDVNNFLYNISNGGDNLALLRTSGPIQIAVLPVKANGKLDYSKKETHIMDGRMTATGSRKDDTINIIMSYKPTGSNKSNLTVSSATITLGVSTTAQQHFFSDYWLLKSARLEVNYKSGGQDVKLNVDVTPKYGYSSLPQDLQCGEGYSVCAPRHLSWSCGSQLLRQVNTTDLKEGTKTGLLQMPDLYFQPFVQGEKKLRFGANWDCEPLIPIALWSSILITLGLAAIVVWALSMVGSIFTPSKFDDPKGPALMIAQTE